MPVLGVVTVARIVCASGVAASGVPARFCRESRMVAGSMRARTSPIASLAPGSQQTRQIRHWIQLLEANDRDVVAAELLAAREELEVDLPRAENQARRGPRRHHGVRQYALEAARRELVERRGRSRMPQEALG